jgi:Flp pilus assembly protein TadD
MCVELAPVRDSVLWAPPFLLKGGNMYWPDGFRFLPGLAVTATLALGVHAGAGQGSLGSAAPAAGDPWVPQVSSASAPVAPPATLQQQPASNSAILAGAAGQAQSAGTIVQSPPSAEELGDSLMSHQRYQAAIEAYKKAPPDSADVWNKMGIAYQLMLNPHEASHCYQISLRLNPKNPRVMNNLGTIYDSMKEYGNAERMYRKALKGDPQSAMFYKNLGTSLLAEHRYKKGWEEYQTALRLDPHIFENTASPRVQNPTSLEERGAMNYYMARGCVRAGMSDCAIQYLRMALNEGFTNPKKIQADIEFAGLRGTPAFQQLIAEQKQQ